MIRGRSGYIPDDAIYPFQGINYSDPSTLIDPHLSPDILNMDVDKGHLRKRPGFTTLGAAVDGTPLAIFEFESFSGVVTLLLITTTKEYKWDGAAWSDITYREPAGNTIVPRTGTEDDGLDYVIVTGEDESGILTKWVIITNGVDKPRYWDGTLATFYEYSTATVANRGAGLIYANFSTCKTISVLNSYLMMANVTTLSNEPTTLAWSDTGSLVNFGTSVSPPPGNAGAIPLTDARGPLRKLEPLGERMMIYADDSIHSAYHTGGESIFAFEKLVDGIRLVSPRAIVPMRGFHMFLAQENVLLFDGGRQLRPIGDAIALRYREELQADLRKQCWGFLDVAKNQVYWGVRVSSNTTYVYKMEYDEYDLSRIKWTKHEYSQRISAMGFWRRTSSLAWNDASLVGVTWQQAAMNWNQGSLKSGFPQRLLGYPTGVGLANEQIWTDNGNTVTGRWESIDFTLPNEYLSHQVRFIETEFEMKGSLTNIYYSVDRGANWQRIVALQPLTGDWKRYKFDIDVTAQQIRFRIENISASGHELRWLRTNFISAGRP